MKNFLQLDSKNFHERAKWACHVLNIIEEYENSAFRRLYGIVTGNETWNKSLGGKEWHPKHSIPLTNFRSDLEKVHFLCVWSCRLNYPHLNEVECVENFTRQNTQEKCKNTINLTRPFTMCLLDISRDEKFLGERDYSTI